LTGLQLPDRPTGAGLVATERASIAGPSTRPSQPRFVEVRPGDSLWRIARSLLPAGATDADITRAWHRLDRLNAERIGDDPDLIRPGTRLAVSVVDPSHRKDPA
jgi:nucleoid-associated protein YgaU